MRQRARRRAAGAAAASAVALTIGVALLAGPPAPAHAEDFPTWSQVQAAKRSVSAKAAEVAKIKGLLARLQQRAATLGTAAITAAVASAAAEQRLAAAEAALHSLQAQATAAGRRAAKARRTAAAVATQLYRAGDPTLSLWMSGKRTGSLLYQLGALAQIGDSSTALLQQAVEQERNAAALGRQAKVQAGIRDHLAESAKRLADAAKAAQDAADAAVASTQKQTVTLQAQLHSLQARSDSLSASYAAEQKAKAAAAAAGKGGGAGQALGSVSPGPGSMSPSGAQSYAQGRMGAYGWDGSQFSCLVSLWNIESGWRWNAYNAGSGAYGIPQSLPGDKMATSGADWRTSSATQINWGLGYISSRYGSPCSAYSFETSHIPYWY